MFEIVVMFEDSPNEKEMVLTRVPIVIVSSPVCG
jgi:hypothetical protein